MNLRTLNDVIIYAADATQKRDVDLLEEISLQVNNWMVDDETKDSVAILMESIMNLIENSGDEEL